MNWQNNFRIFYIPPTLRFNKDIKDNHPNCHQAAAPKKCPSADKPAAHILHFAPQSPCCRPVMFAVIHRCMCSSVPSLSLFPKAAAALLKSSGSPGPAGAGVAGQGEIFGQRAGRSSSRFGRATRQNTITPSLRSFARPLAVHEFAISSALVWWQLTSCKSRRGQWPPPLRAAANLASNTPTPHVPDKGLVVIELAELCVSLTDMLKPWVKHSGRSRHSE